MKVLFDIVATQPVHGAKYHGGGEYSKAVFEAAVKAGYSFDALYDKNRELDPSIRSLCEEHNIPLIDLAGRRFDQAYADYDVFFTGLPYGRFEGARNSGTRLIFTIHGVRSLEMPTDRYEIPFYMGTRDPKRILKALFIRLFPKAYKRIAASRVRTLLSLKNSKVVTVSNHTKYSLLSFFPELSEEDLSVCYSPLNEEHLKDEPFDARKARLAELELQQEAYYLGLGSGRWLKNNLRLARAFDGLISSGKMKGMKLVMTGGKNIVYNSLKNKESFLFLDYVEPELLDALIGGARGLLYPSLNEGFGYPPLQAMKRGVPVLSSAFSASPEVCGDAALYANPYSENELASRILMLENDDLCRELSEKGKLRYDYIARRQNEMLDELLTLIFSESGES